MKTRSCQRREFAWPAALVLLAIAGLLLMSPSDSEGNSRVVLIPHMHVGQTLRYQSRAVVQRHIKTESKVAGILQPAEPRIDVGAELRMTVKEIRKQDGGALAVVGDTEVEQPAQDANPPAANPKVEFTISPNGQVADIRGLDSLDSQQRVAWQFWIARFAYGWTLPAQGVKTGDKWKNEEAETSPAPIADLVWENETTYVRNDTCPILSKEACAVFLTHALLKQKSSPKNATPEDYRLHELKTTGTASGSNETITYISLKTDLLVRATEDVRQAMDVVIAKADGSNQVHYTIDVTSHLETLFVPQ